MRLRPATPADGALLHALVLELATYEREPQAVEATPEVFAAQLAQEPPPFTCVFADLGSEIAGFTLFFPNYSTWRGKPGIWIEEIYVRPAFRGHGVARALVGEGQGSGGALAGEAGAGAPVTACAAAVSRAPEARRAIAGGCGRIDFSVLDWNALAHGFYRRIGARPMSDWTQWRIEEAGFGGVAEEG